MSGPEFTRPLSDLFLRRLRTIAELAARSGGATAKRFLTGVLDVALKPDRSEVSDADLAAQHRVIEVIHRFRPQDPILGEESGPDGSLHHRAVRKAPALAQSDVPSEEDLAVWWVIDPIDGTRNYVRGLPGFGCAVAAIHEGHPVAAATYDAYVDRVYSTSIRDSLLVDDWPLAQDLSSWREDPRVKPLIGMPSGVSGLPRKLVSAWMDEHLMRNYGAAALHMAYVASGGMDATLNADTRLWDIAGGCLLVVRAGGIVTRLDGGPVFPIDVETYHGEPLACLASRDAVLHQSLLAAARSA